jgi:hypothetical protein
MTAMPSKQDAPLRYDDLPRADLDALARRLVAKGYTVAIAGPVRRYTDREEWGDYAVEFVSGENTGKFNLTSGNYLAMLKQVEDLPGANVLGIALDARQPLPRLHRG